MTDAQDLIDALAALEEAPSEALPECMRAVLEAILSSTLLFGREDGEVAVLENAEGETYLALFTTPLDLHFFAPGIESVKLSGDQAIRETAEGRYDGLVINPGSRQFELSREDVLDYFDVLDP